MSYTSLSDISTAHDDGFSMSVTFHLCISHIRLPSSPAPHRTLGMARKTFSLFKANQPRVTHLSFFMLGANRISKQQLNPRLRNRQSELSLDALITYFGMRISSLRYFALVHNIFQGTQRVK